MAGGRPTKYTEELAKNICDRIATGESVRSIGRDKTMPDAATIFAWALRHEKFREQYVYAKETGAETEAEEIEEIARTEEDVQRAKLICDVKKWSLSKKLPKRFGDKQYVDHTTDGKPLILPSEVLKKNDIQTKDTN